MVFFKIDRVKSKSTGCTHGGSAQKCQKDDARTLDKLVRFDLDLELVSTSTSAIPKAKKTTKTKELKFSGNTYGL